MSTEKHRVVVRRVAAHGGGGHGGGWKIAYADFMTAMMAFFLVMWLLSNTSPKQREGIAEHFRMPLKVALSGGEKSSTSISVVPGGGMDPSARIDGEVQRADAEDDADADRLASMKERLDKLIENSPVFRQFRSQILIDITTEGLRLQIVDNENRPMFDLASAQVVPHMRAILRELGPTLNELPNKITLSGHTDAFVYSNGDRSYGNWELSADRANASRRELVMGGMAENKVLRVVGLADSMHLDRGNPRNPINRRISIILLNHRTQQQIEHENSGGGGTAGALRPAKSKASQPPLFAPADNLKVTVKGSPAPTHP
ncbi:chemotaxis protein MotB [Variovorax beijingensis]|uniref:Chemotaxis protein MotB n=2 Tax=Variovorax TaxID=34072 RepID=A0AAE4BY27_VARPD|nr:MULTISPECIES: flagellar motor protein MotB [Variovorax]MDR6426574.1 chemotaxis protein MotB [Variovorax paradoxus]MDR6451173.1 chemotaxis protein MotB [Variovorax paradoxus]TWD78757.1 chemotaxis protein MotB [Variovorax beijingensis]